MAIAWPGGLGRVIGLPTAVHPFYSWQLAGVIWLFGGAYAWLAWSGRRDRGLLGVAAAGKILFFLLFAVYWIEGALPGFAVLSTSGDLVLGGIFATWLIRTRLKRETG